MTQQIIMTIPNNTVLIFNKNNCRILRNPKNFEEYANLPNVLINPDFTAVKGMAPHFWKLLEGKLAPLSMEEMIARETDHVENGVDTSYIPAPFQSPKRHYPIKNILIAFLTSIIILLLYRNPPHFY